MAKFAGTTMKDARETAIGAARAGLKRLGVDPALATVRQYLLVLDDKARSEDSTPEADQTIATRWYNMAEANASQMADFAHEVRKWQREWKRLMGGY